MLHEMRVEDGRVIVDNEYYSSVYPEDMTETFAKWIGLTDEKQREELKEGLFEMTCNLNNPYEFDYRKTTYYVLSVLAEVLQSAEDNTTRFWESVERNPNESLTPMWERWKPICIP